MLEDKLRKDSRQSFSETSQSSAISPHGIRRGILPYALALASLVVPSVSYAQDASPAIIFNQSCSNGIVPAVQEGHSDIADVGRVPLFMLQPFNGYSFGKKPDVPVPPKDFMSEEGNYNSLFSDMQAMMKKKLGVKKFADALGIDDPEWAYVDDVKMQYQLLLKVQPLIKDISKKYKVDPVDIEKIIQHESGGNRLAIGKDYSSGIMQLQPPTYGKCEFGDAINPFIPELAIERGVAVFASYLDRARFHMRRDPALKERFKDKELALVAYNVGVTALDSMINTGQYDEIERIKAEYSDLVLNKKPLLVYAMAK